MDRPNQYIDFSGVRETSSSPDYSACRDDGPHCGNADQTAAPSYTLAPPQHSATGSPRHSTSNGHSAGNSARPSTVKTRRTIASGPVTVAARPGGVPVRRRDSIQHPYALNLMRKADTTALDGTQAESTNKSHSQEPLWHRADTSLFRASAHGRRHSTAVAVLNRDETANPVEPVNTTVSASPNRSDAVVAVSAATTQEDVKRYVATIMDNHAATFGTWEQRVTVAEVYRDKPLRAGGKPAALRIQDRGFLERVITALRAHLQQLEDARSLLLQTRKAVPPTKAGGHGDVNAWDEYCSCYEQTLVDLMSEAKQMQKRVDCLVEGDVQQDGVRTHRTRAGWVPQSGSARSSRARSLGSIASRRDSPQATPCIERLAPSVEGQGAPGALAHAGRVVKTASNTTPRSDNNNNHTAPPVVNAAAPTSTANDRNPHVALVGGGTVRRGSQAIRPGHHHNESAMRASPAPGSQRSWTRVSSVQSPLRASVSSAQSLTSSRSQQQVRSLHPDTVVRLSVPTGSPNDMQSPYGRLMSPKRTSSPLRDPSHAVLVVPRPADVVAEMQEKQLGEEEEEVEAEAEVPVTARSSRVSRASRGSRASRTSRAVSSTNPVSGVPPQLRTYSSPRGTARTASPGAATPLVHPLRRRQLLEVIEHYEKHSATLQRGDLHRARECFYELYGEQQGLRQYCLWIDDIALSALRVPQGPG